MGGWPRTVELTAQICVERPENHGSLNIRPSEVMIKGGPTLTLMGGDAACGYVEGGGNYTVWVQSRPYNSSAPDLTAWRSHDLEVSVKQDARIELVVCVKASSRGYENWDLRRAPQACE